jgi:hypothetical protein
MPASKRFERRLDLAVPARRIDAELDEVAQVAAAPDAEVEAAARELIEERRLLGELGRVVERRQRDELCRRAGGACGRAGSSPSRAPTGSRRRE